ncbi:unnamed protein product, partial [Darwinula stevensoni]
MNPSLTVLFILFPFFVSAIMEQTCPNEDTSPCTCTKYSDGDVRVDCSSASSAAAISSALTKDSWPSIQLWEFVIEDNVEVAELPEGIFGDLSFQRIFMRNTAVKKIHPTAILPFKRLLTYLAIIDSRLENFPFHILHEFRHLRELRLFNNLLTFVPTFKSESLEILRLNSNKITNLAFDGLVTPKLTWLDLHDNWLTSFPISKSDSLELLGVGGNNITSVKFDGWATPNLKKLYLHNNFLTSVLAFRSESLEILSLDNNKITSVDFDGWATPNLTRLDLDNNLLTFVPAFKSGSLEILHLDDNKIRGVEFDGWVTPKLKELHVYNNLLTSFPAIKSESLEILNLHNNNITSMEFDGWATPRLREFSIAKNPLSRLPSEIIKGMKNLEKFFSSECNLGPTLSRGVLEFKSNALKLVTLWGNNISKLDEEPITGLGPNTEVQLTNNEIVVLFEGIFHPMLDILSKGDGVLYLDGLGPNTEVQLTNNEIIVLSEGIFHPMLDILSKGDGVLYLDVCGKKESQIQLSAGGNASEIGEWPWQAAIYDIKKEDVICGGALIREEWVLTAAHCVVVVGTLRPRKTEEVFVHLGKYYRSYNKTDEHVQIRKVSRIILHKDFNLYSNYDSDIALLKLTRPAVLTARVQLVCLPSRFDLSEAILDSGVTGWVAGWGYDGSDELAAVLTEVQLPVISNRKCVWDTLNFTRDPGVTRTLTSNMFCAGFSADTPFEDFRTVCSGDSGSPMVFLSNSSRDSDWAMEGIVSHFFQKGICSKRRPGQYGIFTKVNRFTQWINTGRFLVFFLCQLTVKGENLRGKTYRQLDGVNASIIYPLLEVFVNSTVICANFCLRITGCRAFSLDMNGEADNFACRLAGANSQVGTPGGGVVSELYYECGVVPEGYVFAAMTGGKVHFLKVSSDARSYADALAACEVEGGRLVMDNGGQAWHDHIKHYIASDFWIGADDRDMDYIYTWLDGTTLSVPFWCPQQPDFYDYGGGGSERCVYMRSTWGECWNDALCSQSRPSLCPPYPHAPLPLCPPYPPAPLIP